jgi:hypothetical protein
MQIHLLLTFPAHNSDSPPIARMSRLRESVQICVHCIASDLGVPGGSFRVRISSRSHVSSGSKIAPSLDELHV